MLRRRAFRPVLLLSSALLVFVIALGRTGSAEESSLERLVFEFDSPVTGTVVAGLPERETDLSWVTLLTENRRHMAGFISRSGRRLRVEPFHPAAGIKAVFVSLDPRFARADLDSIIFEAGGLAITGRWNDPPPLVLGDLNLVADSLSIGIVAAADTHRVSFTTTTDPVSDSGIIWVTCPNGFDLSGVAFAVYSDDDTGNDSDEPVIASWDTLGQTIAFQLNRGATPAQPGSRISVRFFPVYNHTIAGDFTVVVITSDSAGVIENGPEVSDPFTLSPESLDHIVILPDTNLIVPAGSMVDFDVSGEDIYNNIIDGLVFTYGVTVDSCGDVIDGVFVADKIGQCYFTAAADGVMDSSGSIDVVPGILGRFSVSGTPSTRTAGQPFPTIVTVTAYDVRDNRKTDYLGDLWFESSDNAAVLFYDSGNPYTYVVGDQGSHGFAGIGFELRTAGVQTVTATNGTVAAESDPVLVTAAPIDTFVFSVGLTQQAGEDFDLTVASANDPFGNPGSGTVLVNTSYGGGSSPDGFPPMINNVEVIGGSGTASQMLTNAIRTVFTGSVGTAVIESDTLTVLPGLLGRFDMAGHPDTITAGETFVDPVTVTVHDIFGNLMTNFGDSVYFTSTDPQALLPYTESSKYRFVPADSGSHSFPGSGFSLRTAGPQVVTVTNGTISEPSGNIAVYPARIDQFVIYAPLSPVTAGVPFTAGVSGCRDAWGNSTNGTVTVSDTVGGGSSPNGTAPVYNSIRVVSGSGSANQTLFNAVTTVLQGVAGNVVAVTDSITVNPGAAGEFDLDISSPQVEGYPFSGTALVSALDLYGNSKVDYDASADTVVIESSAGGVMQNNVLNQAGHFVGGVADLVTRGTSYEGRGGSMTFSAVSESGAAGISQPVEMRGISCDTIIIDQAVLSWGDTASGIIGVTNHAAVDVEITNLDVFTESGLQLQPTVVNPPLPDFVPAGITRIYDILIRIPSDFSVGVHPISSAADGMFGIFSVTDTLAGFPDTVEVQAASNIGYVDGSISRDTLSSGEYYSLSIRLSNTGTAGLSILDSSYFYFTDGSAEFRSTVSSGVYLPPDSPLGTGLILDSTLVDPLFVTGAYQASFQYFGRENGHFLSGTIAISDSIFVESGVSISYITGSQVIDSVVLGQNVAFSTRITNGGTSSLTVDHDNTRIRFSDGNREYVAFSDTSSPVRIDVIAQGDTTLSFARAVLSPDFVAGSYVPRATISGVQNGVAKTITFLTDPDSVRIISRARLRIDTTYIMSMNAPFVNTSQQCSLRVVVTNLGEEPADSVYLGCISDGGSAHPDSIYVGAVDGGSQVVSVYPITAAGSPDSGEVFTGDLRGGVGGISGLPPEIVPPLDNVGLLIIETPAELSLSPVQIVSPPEAQDDTVTVGQPLSISVSVHNHGQADIGGPQRLFFDPGTSGFSVVDSVNRDFSLDQDVVWDIVAPNDPSGSATVHIRFLSYPADANDGSDAVGPDSVSSREFVVDTTPYLLQSPGISWPAGALDGVISTGQEIEASNTITPYGTFANLTSSIILPQGFATRDSLVRHPAGNVVSWHIRSSADTMQDSIGVATWLYDVNTGDSIGTGFEYLQITVVQAASLSLSTRISGPYAALDGIIEPGAYFDYEAVVTNEGEAGVGNGIMSLHLGHPELAPEENVTRDFSAGLPVTWTIAVPDTEISSAIPVWVTVDSIPDEENTGAPAAVINDSSSVFIVIRELLPRLLLSQAPVYSGSVVKGQQLDFLSVRLRNDVRGGSYSLGITDMGLIVETNPAGDASSIVGGALLESVSGGTFPAGLIRDTLYFTFPDTLILPPDGDVSFVLSLTIADRTAVTDFTLSLDGDRVNGLVLDNSIVVGELNAVSPAGTAAAWRSDPVAVLERSFAGSVTSYPNPFNPRIGAARIGYYLEAASDMEVRIFTLLGEEVWSKEISASASLGQAGLHTGNSALEWRGRNSGGYEVRSGVYMCIIRNKSTGEEEKFKIAVVK